MNKQILIAISFLYLFSATAIAENSTNAAEGFSYDYIDTSIVRYNLDTATTKTQYDGYSVYISKSLSKHIHFLGNYMDIERSNGNTLDYTGVGFGVNYPISSSTDILFDYLHYNYDESYAALDTANTGGKFNWIEPKIRHQFTDDIELSAGLLRIDFAGRPVLYKGFRAAGTYRINNDLSLKFEILKAEDKGGTTTVDADGIEFGIRYNF